MKEKKILVVDDEKDILPVLKERLSQKSYSVITSDSGKGGVKLAKSELPDLILLDIIMPDMDGIEVATKLKEDPKTKDIPIIFLTCLYTKEDEKARGHFTAGHAFIAKPYDFEELLAQIRKFI